MRRRHRVIWITGARTGIGLALAQEFHQRGWVVVASSRAITRRDCSWGDTERAIPMPMDVADQRSVRSVVRRVLRTVGVPDILVNNAGVTSFSHFADTEIDEARAILDTNLFGPFLLTKELLPAMVARRSGVILSILSYAAKATYTGSSLYSASKAGAEAMFRVLREELRPSGVRVVNVFPGAVQTPIWSRRVVKRYGDRMMDAQEVARVVAGVVDGPPSVVPEEIVLRPMIGDLRV